jgi:hypothetical protein
MEPVLHCRDPLTCGNGDMLSDWIMSISENRSIIGSFLRNLLPLCGIVGLLTNFVVPCSLVSQVGLPVTKLVADAT